MQSDDAAVLNRLEAIFKAAQEAEIDHSKIDEEARRLSATREKQDWPASVRSTAGRPLQPSLVQGELHEVPVPPPEARKLEVQGTLLGRLLVLCSSALALRR